jgi:hypothetical protein
MHDDNSFYEFSHKVLVYANGARTNVMGVDFNAKTGRVSHMAPGYPAERSGDVRLGDQLCCVDGWWLPPPLHPRFKEMLDHLKKDYLGPNLRAELPINYTVTLILCRPKEEGDESPEKEAVKEEAVDPAAYLMKDKDGNDAGFALAIRAEAEELAAASRGPNDRGGVHLVDPLLLRPDGFQAKVEVAVDLNVTGASPTEVVTSPAAIASPTSPADAVVQPVAAKAEEPEAATAADQQLTPTSPADRKQEAERQEQTAASSTEAAPVFTGITKEELLEVADFEDDASKQEAK